MREGTKLKLEQIVRLSVMEKTPDEIAALLNMAPKTVHDLMGQKQYAKLVGEFKEKIYGPIDAEIVKRKAGQILEDSSVDAADALVDLLGSEDEVTKRIAATAILDRTGHGPIQRKAIRKRVELDPITAKLIALAMRESRLTDGS